MNFLKEELTEKYLVAKQSELEACKKEEDYEPANVLLARIERSRNKKIKKEKLRITKERKPRKTRNS